MLCIKYTYLLGILAKNMQVPFGDSWW